MKLLRPWTILLLVAATVGSFMMISSRERLHFPTDRPSLSFCNYTMGRWVLDPRPQWRYGEECPFHRNAWNCIRNSREGLDRITKWRWEPDECQLPHVEAKAFLTAARNTKIGFIGDSLNENFMVAMLCILQAADPSARKWKHRGAWRGGYFPKFNVTIAYHRAVLLAQYRELQASDFSSGPLKYLGLNKAYRVDADVPAKEWADVLDYYDVLVFNTGHWWNFDKFPADNPLLFYERNEPVFPTMGLNEGLSLVLKHMVAYIERQAPSRTLKLWRTQSPRHFQGGDWNKNGSCISNILLANDELDSWFNGGVNAEARAMNSIILQALSGSSFHVMDVTGLSEFRRDAHPAIWLGRKDAHLVWGQDCMHWCLPGLPDTWVDILSEIILRFLA